MKNKKNQRGDIFHLLLIMKSNLKATFFKRNAMDFFS